MRMIRKGSFWFALASFIIIATIPSSASADTLGQTVSFRGNADYDADGSDHLDATLLVVSDRAYFYVDRRYWNALFPAQQEIYRATLRDLGSVFDQTIYPRMTAFWGSEATPGVDGDPRITIVVQKTASGIGGYFMSLNGYPASAVEGYNVREMFYVSADGIAKGQGENFLAHEFQHLISQNQKEFGARREEDRWLNEARSEYSPTVAGFSEPFQGSNLQHRAQAFLRDPDNSLVQWNGDTADYAIITMFIHYLADRYGADIVQSTINEPEAGIDAINAWLMRTGKSERFPELFADWGMASFVNDRSSDIRYGYAREGLNRIHVTPGTTFVLNSSLPFASQYTLQEWEPIWTTYIPPTGEISSLLQVQLTGATGAWYCAVAARYGNTIDIRNCQNGSLALPTIRNGVALSEMTVLSFQGENRSVDEENLFSATGTLTVTFTDEPTSTAPKDGDIIRHNNEPEMYVVWGKYRRLVSRDVLAQYGFQDRPVFSVDDGTFNQFVTSNYARVDGTEQVYALWPDGTKHWLNITPAQWDASGRDWNAIFIINEAEGNLYTTGAEITR